MPLLGRLPRSPNSLNRTGLVTGIPGSVRFEVGLCLVQSGKIDRTERILISVLIFQFNLPILNFNFKNLIIFDFFSEINLFSIALGLDLGLNVLYLPRPNSFSNIKYGPSPFVFQISNTPIPIPNAKFPKSPIQELKSLKSKPITVIVSRD